MKRISEDKIVLCGKGSCKCPTITKLPDGSYEILDDDGNKIKVKKEELEMVSDAVKALETTKEQLIYG